MTRLRLSPVPAAVPADQAEDEAALLAELRLGGIEAVARAYDRWHGRVRTLARRLLSEQATSEDVVQEVFVSLPRAVRRFRGQVTLETFVLAITVKRARHHLRSAIRRRRALERLAEPGAASPHDPEHEAYQRQLAGRLAAALDRLPLAQRVAFVLCEVEGLTSARASVLAAAPEPTVRTRLFHARRRLRALLAPEHDE
jgi:RNA polymerase sigma-70 factor (ECF subfamily)